MKKLIITADDYGYTESINEGIIRATTQGIVTDIAVMVLTDSRELEHGIKLLQEHKLTEIGLHTSLFHWGKEKRPVRSDFINFFKTASDQDIEKLVMEEIYTFENLFGCKPKFIAPQYNMHGNLRMLKVIAGYASKNNIPVRVPWSVLMQDEIEDNNYAGKVYLERLGVKMTHHLFAHILGSDSTSIQRQFIDELKTVNEGESTEIILHPGYFDEPILSSSSLNYERARDIAIALNKEFKKQIQDLGFEFNHFSAI